MALTDKLSAIGSAIREKTGKSDLLTLDAMPAEIAAIETGGGDENANAFEDWKLSGVYNGEDGYIMDYYENSRITKLVDSAMSGMAIRKVSLPNVETVGSSAFENMSYLTKINAPKVTSLPTNAFRSAGTSEKPFTLDMPLVTSVDSYAFQNAQVGQVILPSVTYIGGQCFYGCQSMDVLDCPENTNYLVSECISYCSNLRVCNLPKTTELGWAGMSQCSSIQALNFPALTSISSSQNLQGFESLKRLDLGQCQTISSQIASNCSALHTLVLRYDGVCSLGADASSWFSSTKLPTTGYIYVPAAQVENYKVATNWASVADRFRAIEDYLTETTFGVITSVDLDASNYLANEGIVGISLDVTSLDATLFKDCANLYYANLPSLTVLDDRAFYGCSSLKVVKMPKVTSIGYMAFRDCSNLGVLDLPATLSNVDSSAFSQIRYNVSTDIILRRTTKVTAGGPVADNGYYAYAKPRLFVPAALVDSYKADSNWANYFAEILPIEGSDYEEV